MEKRAPQRGAAFRRNSGNERVAPGKHGESGAGADHGAQGSSAAFRTTRAICAATRKQHHGRDRYVHMRLAGLRSQRQQAILRVLERAMDGMHPAGEGTGADAGEDVRGDG